MKYKKYEDQDCLVHTMIWFLKQGDFNSRKRAFRSCSNLFKLVQTDGSAGMPFIFFVQPLGRSRTMGQLYTLICVVMSTKGIQGKLWSVAPEHWAQHFEPWFLPMYRKVLD